MPRLNALWLWSSPELDPEREADDAGDLIGCQMARCGRDLEAFDRGHQQVESVLKHQPCQVPADAAMGPESERDVAVGRSPEIQRVRALERILIAVRGGDPGGDGVACPYHRPVHLH